VTSDTTSTEVETLVQRLIRSSTSIQSERPAWKRTSDVVAAQTADTVLLERLNHLTVKLVTPPPPNPHFPGTHAISKVKRPCSAQVMGWRVHYDKMDPTQKDLWSQLHQPECWQFKELQMSSYA